MKIKIRLLAGFLLALLIVSCTPKTPKVVEKPVDTKPTPAPPDEDLSPCPKFSDLPFQEADEMETEYVIYRDMMKAGETMDAYERWKKVYAKAPAADGKRNTVYADGIYFNEYFISQTQDSTKINEYIDKIFEIYAEIDRCYADGNFSDGRKAFDLFYKYPHRSTKEDTYKLFKKVIDADGEDMPYFTFNPFAALIVDMHNEKKIDDAEAKKYVEILNRALAKQLAECKGKECDRYTEIKRYMPERLEYFERIKGFYDCTYFSDKYYAEYQESPDDCDNMLTVLSRMKYGGCTPENSTQYSEILNKYTAACRTVVDPGNNCYTLLQNAEYKEAIDCFKEKAANESDVTKKAKYTLLVAKIYYAHLKNFPQARKYAEQAASIRGSWGEPYLLIGRMYASSGPLCGSGRGWNSQIVVWPALDMWYKAKSIDPEAAPEANKFINRYSQYMPNKEDIFIRSLKVGDNYKVPCWIQRTTKIRASDG